MLADAEMQVAATVIVRLEVAGFAKVNRVLVEGARSAAPAKSG
jgi:hypothetical protein